MMNLMQYITPTLVFPIVVLAAMFCLLSYYRHAMSPREGTLEWVTMASAAPRPLSFPRRRFPMRRKDALPLLLLTAVYAFTAFWNLGSFTNPQSFCQLSAGETVTFTLAEPTAISRVMYYTGLNTGSYTLEASPDGETWYTLLSYEDEANDVSGLVWRENGDGSTLPAGLDTANTSAALHQKYSDLFKWIDNDLLRTGEGPDPLSLEVRMFRLTGNPDSGDAWLELGELALYDADGALITLRDISYTGEGASPLFDEGETVPAMPTWYNSSYFDEIYHPRTAYEHIRGIYPYEISHPPLGKLIIGLGIRMFGLTPFGWRFMGALFGVLMVPLLYVFLKNLFGKTVVAFCGTALFAFDFMHLTQTRIATIDTYGVFFILAMYYFMYRYLTLPAGTPFRKGALPLFLSGLMWGIGAASKWTVIYGAVGLALLYFIGLYFKWRDWPREEVAPRFGPWLVKTLLFSVLCFVLIPAVIYTASYLPYAAAQGDTSLENLIKVMWDNQVYMLTYHEGVHTPHPYSSRWYQWIVDGRPILYYLDNQSGAAQGLKCAFGAFSNPIVCWGGLLAMIACAAQSFRRFRSKMLFFLLSGLAAAGAVIGVDGVLSAELDGLVRLRNLCLLAGGVLIYWLLGYLASKSFPRYSSKALFILIGYLSQLVPWMFIGRITFAYHYFPSILFLVLALAYVFNDLVGRRAPGWRAAVYGTTGGAVALYAAFYPVLVGIMVPTWYTTNFLRWIPGAWPF